MNNKKIGKIGEDIGVIFLRQKGYRILYRNWRCANGEIDIVGQEKNFLVFIEIKTRRSISFGPGYLSVDQAKQIKLIQLAKAFLRRYNLEQRPCRIDVISIDLDEHDHPERIELIRDAFWEEL